MVGHEIRTPLTTALMYISILEHHIGATARQPSVRSALDVAREEIRRLEQLVGRITDLQRLGRPVLQPRLTEVGSVVEGTVRRTLVGAGATAVAVTVAAESGLWGWWDVSAVEQIVQNLLSNALKFGRGLPVRIRVEPAPSGARLVVQDQGTGIGRADQGKIFRRYVRSMPHRSGGLGLGLWLVRELAQAHGGWVTVRSRPGQGATFRVTLRQLPPGETSPGAAAAVPHPLPAADRAFGATATGPASPSRGTATADASSRTPLASGRREQHSDPGLRPLSAVGKAHLRAAPGNLLRLSAFRSGRAARAAARP
jgi:signal transduction histidine kinase